MSGIEIDKKYQLDWDASVAPGDLFVILDKDDSSGLFVGNSIPYVALDILKIDDELINNAYGKKYFIPASELDRLRQVANDDAGSTENESSIPF